MKPKKASNGKTTRSQTTQASHPRDKTHHTRYTQQQTQKKNKEKKERTLLVHISQEILVANNFPPDSIPLHKSFFLLLTTQISSSTTRSRIRFSLVVAFFCFLALRFLIYPFFDFCCCFLPGFACKQGRGRQSHYKIG